MCKIDETDATPPGSGRVELVVTGQRLQSETEKATIGEETALQGSGSPAESAHSGVTSFPIPVQVEVCLVLKALPAEWAMMGFLTHLKCCNFTLSGANNKAQLLPYLVSCFGGIAANFLPIFLCRGAQFCTDTRVETIAVFLQNLR